MPRDTLPEVLSDLQRQITRLERRLEELSSRESTPFGRVYLRQGVTRPAPTPGFAVVYIDADDQALKITFADGSIHAVDLSPWVEP